MVVFTPLALFSSSLCSSYSSLASFKSLEISSLFSSGVPNLVVLHIDVINCHGNFLWLQSCRLSFVANKIFFWYVEYQLVGKNNLNKISATINLYFPG